MLTRPKEVFVGRLLSKEQSVEGFRFTGKNSGIVAQTYIQV